MQETARQQKETNFYTFYETELVIYPSDRTDEKYEVYEGVTHISCFAFEDSN